MSNANELNQSYYNSLVSFCQYQVNIYSRTLFVRVDLHYPSVWDTSVCLADSLSISKFVAALKVRISNATKDKTHTSSVGYAWCKEISPTTEKPHYHILLAFNGNSYISVGMPDQTVNNLFAKICHSWASALGLHPGEANGLVYVPDNANYRVGSGASWNHSVDDVIQRGSYLCKKATKVYGDRTRSFQTSRVPKEAS